MISKFLSKTTAILFALSLLFSSCETINEENTNKLPIYCDNLTISVTNLPESVKAISLWGTPNEFKLENIQKQKNLYIADIENGTATFKLGTYHYPKLECQLVPMTSRDMTMYDATWWKNAFSGSSKFKNAKNNLVYEFENNSENNITLTLDIKSIYGDVSTEVFTTRFFTENYKTAFKVTIK